MSTNWTTPRAVFAIFACFVVIGLPILDIVSPTVCLVADLIVVFLLPFLWRI